MPYRKRAGKLAALMLVTHLAGPAQAAFQSIFASPRAAGMAGASLSDLNGSTAMFLNPAGSARMDGTEVYFMYNQLYAGLSGVGGIGQGFLSLGLPTRFGTVGLGLGGFRAEGLLEERVLALNYARSLGERLQVGVMGKMLHHSYLIDSDPAAALDPVFSNGSSKGAFALDVGLIASPLESIKVGFSVRNLNQPDVGLADEDRVPRELQAGLAYESKERELRLVADVSVRANGYQTLRERTVPGIGLEKGFADGKIRFRAGVTPLDFTGGFGVRLGRVGFDYALVLKRHLLADNMGSHMAGVSFQFGGGEDKEGYRDR